MNIPGGQAKPPPAPPLPTLPEPPAPAPPPSPAPVDDAAEEDAPALLADGTSTELEQPAARNAISNARFMGER
jgi:hypothetical protein